MRNIITPIFLLVFCISLISALPVCLDTNAQDISKVPCVGFTVPIDCSTNVTVFNATDQNINFTIPTEVFTDDIYNFTFNLSKGEYHLVDCQNNTATVVVTLVEQGYGITMFIIVFPSILLSLICLFVSGRMFKRFGEDDEEEHEHLSNENDEDSFVPRSRLMPLIFMLFAFIPMIFMVGFVRNHLQEYLPLANITAFYGSFYILLSIVFYFVFLLSFVVWLSSFIKMRKVMRGLDDID